MSGWNEAMFVVRPAQRIFDTPENRALKWLLHRLDTELGRTTRAEIIGRQVAPFEFEEERVDGRSLPAPLDDDGGALGSPAML